MKKRLPLYIAALIAVFVGIFAAQYHKIENTLVTEKIQGVILPEAKTLNEFTLIDNRSETFSIDSLKNHWSLIFIGYTHCPDVCPTTLNILQQVEANMKQQSLTPPVITFISIDPERDTPSSLNEYIKYFSDDFIAVTGSLKELKNMAVQLSVFFKKSPGSSGDISQDDYLMDHSSSLILINPDAKLQTFITAPHTPQSIIQAIQSSKKHFQSKKNRH